jgi:hypothetical protein
LYQSENYGRSARDFLATLAVRGNSQFERRLAMVRVTFNLAISKEIEELRRIGRTAIERAQEESRRLGVPTVHSINGVLHWELPNGELSRTDPYVQ